MAAVPGPLQQSLPFAESKLDPLESWEGLAEALRKTCPWKIFGLASLCSWLKPTLALVPSRDHSHDTSPHLLSCLFCPLAIYSLWGYRTAPLKKQDRVPFPSYLTRGQFNIGSDSTV